MSIKSVSDLFQNRERQRNNSVRTEVDMDFREGVLLLNNDGVFVQRYFTVYDYKIVYAYRGKERKHEFSPLTTIEESPAGLRGQHTFRISTEGQKTLELCANNREDMSDWIKAIKDEVGKIIVSIMEDFEKPGYGPFSDIIHGSLIEEGVFASFVLRQQGSKVIPIFMVLRDGKLSIRKRPTDAAELGSWKVGIKTTAEILATYAGAAFKLDKEILLSFNLAIRSNWIVALKRTIQKASGIKGAGSARYTEVNFGTVPKTEEELAQEAREAENKALLEEEAKKEDTKANEPEKKDHTSLLALPMETHGVASIKRSNSHTRSQSLPDSTGSIVDASFNYGGTMVIKPEEDDDNDFYKTFAGSVRIAAKVSLENFSTFREVEGLDDDQEKFANMKLEFEEVQSDEEENKEVAAVVSMDETEENSPDEKPAPPQLKISSSQELLLPASRSPNRIRSPSNAKKPNMMRIWLKSKAPEGPIKIYRGVLESKDEFKCLIISSDTKTEETLRVAIEEFQANSLMYLEGKYVLVEEEVGDIPEGQPERYRRVLDSQESPLIARLNWDNRNMRFSVASKQEFVTELVEGVNFRVKCMDMTTYALKFHAKISVSRVCEMLAEKFQLQKISYSLFSLWMIGEKLELQLEPFKQLGPMADEWPKLEKTFTEQESGTGYSLHYRRWAFLSKSAERRIKDPQAINLLYEQAAKLVMEEIYPIPIDPEDLVILASHRCQLMFGDYKEDLHVPGYIYRQSEGLSLLFPQYYFNQIFKREDTEKKIIKLWKTFAKNPKMITQMLYLQVVRQWPYYGCTFFPAVMTTTTKSNRKISLFEEKTKSIVRVGVNVEGIYIVDAAKNLVLFSDDLQEITLLTDLRMPKSFIFESKKAILSKNTLEKKKDRVTVVCLTSPQFSLIQSFVQSSLRQQQEDARALRILRNLQRKRSATDAQNFHREHQLKFSTQKHISPSILRQVREDAEPEPGAF